MITANTELVEKLVGARVLVTGATGFIGAQLVAQLVSIGASVAIVYRDSSKLDRLANLLPQLVAIEADLEDWMAVKNAVQIIRPQFVFHLGARVNVSRDPHMSRAMMQTNLNGTMHLLLALEGVDYQCFVNSGTCEEYGDNPVPFHESQVVNPVSPYSASKAAATVFCKMLHKTVNSPIVTVRPFLTFGPNQNLDRLLPQAIMAALQNRNLPMTGGQQTREFNYVTDIVDGYLRAAIYPAALGETINLGNGQPHTLREVVRLIYRLTESKGEPKFGEMPYRTGEAFEFYCDNTKARNLLQWQPQVSLHEGLQRTIAWYRERKDTGACVK